MTDDTMVDDTTLFVHELVAEARDLWERTLTRIERRNIDVPAFAYALAERWHVSHADEKAEIQYTTPDGETAEGGSELLVPAIANSIAVLIEKAIAARAQCKEE